MKTSGHNFKHHAITRLGYEYQDLVSLKFLVEFYLNKDLYEWIELEAPDKGFAAIDDIVTLRKADQKYELVQVKFTVDPNRDDLSLSWDWLLSHTPKGTSNLQKWSKTVLANQYKNQIHSAQLVTNRIPDKEFGSCLSDDFVLFKDISAEVQSKIILQLGSEDLAREFFSCFQFQHSQPVLDDLYNQLRDRLIPSDTDEGGWLLLLDQIKKWATRKNTPQPHGKVFHQHITELLSLERPRSLNQQFSVPDDYVIPNDDFHSEIIKRVKDRENWTVIWGVPGRGKSTYLSNLVDLLNAEKITCLRHHYFLSMTDTSTDRISFDVLASSLMNQMRSQFPELVSNLERGSSSLSKWIKICTDECALLDKPLVIVVDGLDHVWREGRNVEQMQHFFKHLNVGVSNLVIVVGTQKVADEHLPAQLLIQCPKTEWIELPALNVVAVQKWLELKFQTSDKLNKKRKRDYWRNISVALHKISYGHPLHLIYSIEFALRNDISLTEENIYSLPECPDGDIRTYYQSLWNRLNPDAKLALHLISGTKFNWPSLNAVRSVLSKASLTNSLDDIDHLLERRSTEIVPFHGSILAWIREMEDHTRQFDIFASHIINWLETIAPEYWRWAYLLVQKSEHGDSDDLLNQIGRNWAISAVKNGRPFDVIIQILRTAEYVALDKVQLGKLIELRSIKMRLLNAPEFQIHEFHIFQEAVWNCLNSSFAIEKMFDDLSRLSNEELLILSLNKHASNIPSSIDRVYDEFITRQNRVFNNGTSREVDYDSIIEPAIRFVAHNDILTPKNTAEVIEQFQNSRLYLKTTFWSLLAEGNVEKTIDLAKLCQDKGLLNCEEISEILVRIASTEGFDLASHSTLNSSLNTNLYKIWHYYKHQTFPGEAIEFLNNIDLTEEISGYGKSNRLITFLKNSFFAGLATGLSSAIPSLKPHRIKSSDDPWIKSASIDLFNNGLSLAEDIKNNSKALSFATIFELCRTIIAPKGSSVESGFRQYSNFRFALLEIARECCLLGWRQENGISKDCLETAISSTHWVEDIWIEFYLEHRFNYCHADAVEMFVKSVQKDLHAEVTQFDERTLKFSQLSCMASRFDLQDIAMELLNDATDCMLGYGYRKDYWLWDVISAVKFCSHEKSIDVDEWIRTLAPVIDKVDVFTDGDEIPHAKGMFADLLMESNPELLPNFYNHLVDQDEWYEADKIFHDYLQFFDLDNVFMRSVANTIIDTAGATIIANEIDPNSDEQVKLLERLKHQNGLNFKEEVSGKTTKHDDERPVPKYAQFKPNELSKLLSDLDSRNIIMGKDTFLINWIKYWAEEKREFELITSFENHIDEAENLYSVSRCFDEVFEITLKVYGKSRAYKWLVLSQIENNGWSRWQGDEERRARVEKAAAIYPKKWLQFIIDTSRSDRYGDKSSIILGSDYLVHFLLKSGQIEKAKEVTTAMVETISQEMIGQPIGEAAWLE